MSSTLKSLRALSDPTRLRIVALLETRRTVRERTAGDHAPRPVAHLHASGLARGLRAGAVAARRQTHLLPAQPAGRRRGERIHPTRHSRREGTAPSTAATRSISSASSNRRREQAQVFFNQVAGRFDRVYGPGRSWQAFGHLLLRILPPLVVADLGAGEGLLSELLARRCKKVIAVDNSEKIVAFGAAKAKKNGLKNLEFRLGDLQNPPIEAGQRGPRDSEPGAASRRRSGGGAGQRGQTAQAARPDPDSRSARSTSSTRPASFTATAGSGFAESDLHRWLEAAGFKKIEISVVAREEQPPHFQTILASGEKG